MTAATLLPTYARACTYRPPFLRLCLRRLRALGLPVTDEQIEGRYTRWSGDRLELGRGEILILEPTAMTLSLNQRARELADRLAADAEALRVAVTTLPGGTRLIDCGSAVPGGLEAGRRFAEICMGGLGSVGFAPLVLDGRWLPGADGRHRPSRARVPRLPVRGLADRPRRLLRHGQRARAAR